MSDRVAVLTGVTGGWGRAVLDRFAAQGWTVVATHRGDAPGDLPADVIAVEADLTDPASAEAVVMFLILFTASAIYVRRMMREIG